MTPTNQNARQMVTLFGVLGFVFGWCFPAAFGGWIFYTTKPLEFIDGWMIPVIAASFGASLAAIPFAVSAISRSSAGGRYFTPLFVLTGVWAVIVFSTSVVVRIVTATVHQKTLHIPIWLIPVSLILVAVVPGVIVLALGYLRARRHESCA